MRPLYSFLFFLCFLIPSLPILSAEGITPYFDAHVISSGVLTPPLEVGSEEWEDEIEEIVDLQKKPSTVDIFSAAEEREMAPELVTLPVLPKLSRARFPNTYRLLDRAGLTSKHVTRQSKVYFNTKRPYLASDEVKALIEPHDNPAYPSGHTSGSYVWAHIMGMLIKDKRADFRNRAEKIAQRRVLVGMHYPHDIEGGKELALITMGALMESTEFQADVQRARNELKKRKFQ